jgi:hypothetical protein
MPSLVVINSDRICSKNETVATKKENFSFLNPNMDLTNWNQMTIK